MYPAITIATVIALEDVGDGATHFNILVNGLQAGLMIKVRTASKSQLSKEI
jgi:hypothetical protein